MDILCTKWWRINSRYCREELEVPAVINTVVPLKRMRGLNFTMQHSCLSEHKLTVEIHSDTWIKSYQWSPWCCQHWWQDIKQLWWEFSPAEVQLDVKRKKSQFIRRAPFSHLLYISLTSLASGSNCRKSITSFHFLCESCTEVLTCWRQNQRYVKVHHCSTLQLSEQSSRFKSSDSGIWKYD